MFGKTILLTGEELMNHARNIMINTCHFFFFLANFFWLILNINNIKAIQTLIGRHKHLIETIFFVHLRNSDAAWGILIAQKSRIIAPNIKKHVK